MKILKLYFRIQKFAGLRIIGLRTIVISLVSLLVVGAAFAAETKHPFERIKDAVEAGRITAYQGLVYKVLLLQDQSRVPEEFRGKLAGSDASTGVIREAVESFSSMPQAEQDLVLPYLMPPAYRETVGKNRQVEGLAAKEGEVPAPLPAINWTSIESVTSNLRVWYAKDNADHEHLAQLVRAMMGEEIMRKELNLMGKELVQDSGRYYTLDSRGNKIYWGNGGDGKFDIYLSPLDADTYATAFPYPVDPDAAIGCKERPAYIVVNTRRDWAGKPNMLRGALAHEFFHAIQYSLNRKALCKEYDGIDEGTATWAEDYVFPKGNTEHEYFRFFEDGNMSLIDGTYGTWTFFYFMTQNFGNDRIRALHDQMASMGPFDALNAVLPGGFKKQWPEFVRLNWNHYPLDEKSFLEWDEYDWVPGRGAPDALKHIPPIETETVAIKGDGTYRYKMSLSLAPLTRSYYRFEFTSDQNVRSVSIENPLNFLQDRGSFKVMVKYANSAKWKVEDWIDGIEDREICLDKKDERIEEVILMYSNWRHESDAPRIELEPSLLATNLGCHEYGGYAKSVFELRGENTRATMSIEAKDVVFHENGRNEDKLFKGQYYLKAATAKYNYSGVYDGCTGQASGVAAFKMGPGTGSALGLYPYHVSQSSARQYAFGKSPEIPYVMVTHQCPPPRKPLTVPVSFGFFMTSGSSWGVGPALSDGTLQGSNVEGIGTTISTEWKFTPIREQ